MWTFALALVLMSAVTAWEALGPTRGADLVGRSLVQALVYGGFVFLLWQRYLEKGPLLATTGFRRTDPGLVVLGLVLGVTLQAPVDALQALSELLWPGFTEVERVQRALLFRTQGTLHEAMMFLSIAALVPLVEESMFRGALFGALCKESSARGAAFVSGICFLVSHTDYRLWPALSLVAFVLSYLRVLAGSLLPCLALHGAFNATTLVCSLEGWVPIGERLDLSWVTVLLGTLGAGALIYCYRWVAGCSRLAKDAREADARRA